MLILLVISLVFNACLLYINRRNVALYHKDIATLREYCEKVSTKFSDVKDLF